MMTSHKPRPWHKPIVEALADVKVTLSEIKETTAQVPEPLLPVLLDIKEIMRLVLEELKKGKK